ncbi:MAG: amidohydrolase family protein [Balneolaceae bacterium]|nr:amidohydrolase family protein [Balneolaceae bacterium]
MKRFRILLLLISALLFSPFFTLIAQPPTVDHHLHIRSEDGTQALVRILDEVQGQQGVKLQPSVEAGDVVALLDSTGTEKAVLLSTAYFFAMPDLEFENERERLRRENEYVAEQAGHNPDRLIPFCAVNPLSEYALEEITWCGEDERFAGLKLHLANSDLDFRNEQHVKALQEVFKRAGELDLALIVHLWTRHPDFGAKDTEIFIQEILPEAGDVTVQIAHLGGPGTYSEVTREVAGTFSKAIQNGEVNGSNLYFDLAEVPERPERASDEQERQRREQANRELADLIRELGTDRVLWGTDWIAGPPQVYMSKLQWRLPDDLWDAIRENKAPYLR